MTGTTAFSSTSVKVSIDMGDAGKVGVGNGTDIAGISAKYDDKLCQLLVKKFGMMLMEQL